MRAMQQYWEQQLQQSAAIPVGSLSTVEEVTAVLEHHGFLKRTLEPLDAAVAKLAAISGESTAIWSQTTPDAVDTAGDGAEEDWEEEPGEGAAQPAAAGDSTEEDGEDGPGEGTPPGAQC